MEQKQLDEMDESFFVEEFVEDEPSKLTETGSEDKIKIEETKEVGDVQASRSDVKKSKKASSKSAVKKSEKKASSTKKESAKKDEIKLEKEEIKITPAKEAPKEESPVDPWKKEESSDPLKSAVSTWKVITGVAVMLLVISLFTQGFNFTDGAGLTGSSVAEISLSEAEAKVLEFVNTNLLQLPFLATVVSSEELDNLHKVTLSVAGKVVDSYLTKDGKLFFPQGFDMENPGLDLPNDQPVDLKEEKDPVEEPVKEEKDIIDVITIPMNAKKWVFTPSKIDVNQGETVRLMINSKNIGFTFAIPDLGVEQNVLGTSTVEFVADKKGEFEFKCGSCEEWRGMTGTLTVK